MADVKILNGYDIKDAKALRTKDTVGTGSFIDTRAGTNTYPTTEAHTESLILGKDAHVRSSSARAGLTILGNGTYATMSYSTVIGDMAHATASMGTAYGYNANSSGDQAIAIGPNANATQQYAVAVGSSAGASQNYTTAIGFSSSAYQGGATAIGAQASATAQYSTIVGRSAATYTSNSTYAVAVGFGAKAGTSAVALGGANTEATGQISVALGAYAKATASYAVQIGQGTNNKYGTLQFRDWQLVKGDGKIPEERLPDGIKTATPQFPNLYNINEENVSEQAVLYTGTTNDSYKNSQFYRGRVRYGYPRFSCSWVDTNWLDSYNDVMIDQQKFFTKLAEVTKQRIDNNDVANGLIGGDNAEQSVYLLYDADNDYYLLRFDNDSFEKAFNGTPDNITGLSFDDLADYGIYFRNFHKPNDLEGEYEFCDIYYYAPVYIDGYDWSNSPSYMNYFQFLDAMNDSDWGIGVVIPSYNTWEYEVNGTTYQCPIIPKTYEWNGDEYDNIEIRWEWQNGSWYQYINGEDISRDWTTAEMYTTFGIKIEPGEEENVEYVGLTVRGGDQRYWEQFDPVNIENFATADQLENLSDEVDAIKNWSVQVVTGGKDLDNYTTEGVYQFVGAPITNKPSTVNTHFIMLVQVSSTFVKQIIFATRVDSVVGNTSLSSYAPAIFHRTRKSGVWASWQTVLSGDWANYVTGFDRTKQQKLIHQDNTNGDGTSAVPMWVADTGGGSVDIDNSTITKNGSDQLQAVATINANTAAGATNPVYDWVGTLAEYTSQAVATNHPEWLCYITDDLTAQAYSAYTKTQSDSTFVAKGHEVIAFQAPNAGNNYTWYRKYADGWVEQGGAVENNSSASNTINLPVTMSDTHYTVVLGGKYDSNSAIAMFNSKTTNSFVVTCQNYNHTDAARDFDWQVSGMAA